MNRCLDTETLVAIGTALDWDAMDALEHVAQCEGCRGQLDRLATLHGALAEEIDPNAGFTSRVVGSLVARETERIPPGFGLADLINPAFAGATAFFAIALASAQSGSIQMGPPVLLAAAAAAGAAYWRDRSTSAVTPSSPGR